MECGDHDLTGLINIENVSIEKISSVLKEYTGLGDSIVNYVLLDYSIKINICSECNYKEHSQFTEKTLWKCDMRDIYYCNSCMNMEHKFVFCKVLNCMDCNSGYCLNNKLAGQFCCHCFSIIDNSDSDNFNKIVLELNYNT